MNITISGLPCSGKSSIANYLAEKYGFKKINAGQIFREEAEKRNLTLNELSDLCKKISVLIELWMPKSLIWVKSTKGKK